MAGAFLRRYAISLIFFILLLAVCLGWWQSSRYSERRLFYLGNRTVEIFTASSLMRLSFIDGHVANLGRQLMYRHRNARGKMQLRPLAPTFQKEPAMIHVTLGFWHLALIASLGLLGSLGFSFSKHRKNRNASRLPCDRE